jgi:hypothetical protein
MTGIGKLCGGAVAVAVGGGGEGGGGLCVPHVHNWIIGQFPKGRLSSGRLVGTGGGGSLEMGSRRGNRRGKEGKMEGEGKKGG